MKMNQPDRNYQLIIEQLREQSGFDFVALAFARSAEDDFVITWQYASGNLNNRYKRIVLHSGKGIAGIVFKTGKSMMISNVMDTLQQRDHYQYPILVSERLRSLAAIPLYQYDRAAGVLLVAYREENRLTQQAFEHLQQTLSGSFGAYEIKELTLN
jgi:nitrogen regulatory protein A